MGSVPTLQAKIAQKLLILNQSYLNNVPNAFLGSSNLIDNNLNIPSGSGECITNYQSSGCVTETGYSKNVMNSLLNFIQSSKFVYSGSSYNNLYTANSGTITQSTVNYFIGDSTNTPNINIYNLSTNNTNNYVQYPITSSSFTSSSLNYTNPNPQATTPYTSDINLIELLLALQSSAGPALTSVPTSVYCLQALYAWYSLLDNNTWKLFVNGGTVQIYVPDLIVQNPTAATGVTKNIRLGFSTVTVTYNGNTYGSTYSTNQLSSQILLSGSSTPTDIGTNIASLMNYFIPFSSVVNAYNSGAFNPFVARRLIHLDILLFNFNIGLSYYAKNTPSSSTPEYLSGVYKLIQAANINVNDTSGGTFQNILQGVQRQQYQYNNSSEQLSTLNNKLSNYQTAVITDSTKLSATNSYQDSVKKYKYIAVIILIVVLIVAALIYFTPLSSRQKLAASAILIIVSVVSSITLQYLVNSTFTAETFYAAGDVGSQTLGTGVVNTGSLSDMINNYGNPLYTEIDTYLNNTILLSNTLDSYHLYSNVNNSLQQQNSYYSDAVTNLKNKDFNIQAANEMSYLEQVKYGAVMNFVTSITLLIAIYTTVYISLNDYPVLKYYSFIFMIICVIIISIIFIYEYSRPVRTHSKQVYWYTNTDTLRYNLSK